MAKKKNVTKSSAKPSKPKLVNPMEVITSVGSLLSLLQKIDELRKEAARLRGTVQSVKEDVQREALRYLDTLPFGTSKKFCQDLYWSHSALAGLTSTIYLLAFQMRFKPEPRAVPFTCDDCGSPVIDKDMLYASWAEYKRLCKLCDACKEAEDAEMPDDEDSDDEVEDSDDWEEVDDEVEDSDDEEVDSDYFDDQSVEVVLSAGCVGANDESETDWRKRRPRAGTLSVRELQEIARIDYARYLQTEHWQAVRKARNRRANYRCEKCKADNPRPRVHHRSYERIGCELLEDVISYCNKCHESEHDIEKMKAAGVIKS